MVNKEDKRREKLGWPAWVELGVPKTLRTGLNFTLVFTLWAIDTGSSDRTAVVMVSQTQRREMNWRL